MSNVQLSIEYAAEKLHVSLPVPQNEVKETIEKLLAVLEDIHRANTTVHNLIDLVRDNCSHPETVNVTHTGHPYTRCTTCGKEW